MRSRSLSSTALSRVRQQKWTKSGRISQMVMVRYDRQTIVSLIEVHIAWCPLRLDCLVWCAALWMSVDHSEKSDEDY
jgi:hypothetical protein